MGGGDLRGRMTRTEFAGVSIDTRTLRPASCSSAIRGERFDGADFAGAAIEARAAGVVVPQRRGGGRANGSAAS